MAQIQIPPLTTHRQPGYHPVNKTKQNKSNVGNGIKI